MDFINKLIKKGIFGLALCFSVFIFLSAEKVSAESDCKIKILNDGEYLVINEGVNWSDSGASVTCGTEPNVVTHKDISVSVNGGNAVTSANYGQYISDSYVKNAGYYTIRYSWTSDDSISITRRVRVLSSNLSDKKTVWVGDFENNTTADDVFVKIVDYGNNYLAIGNFGTGSYVVCFEATGKYLWHQVYENTKLHDIAKSGDGSGKIYYVVGQRTYAYEGTKTKTVGVVKSILLNDDKGINESSSFSYDLTSMTSVNKVMVFDYVYVVGYLSNDNGTTAGVISRLENATLSFTNIKTYSNTLDSQYNSIIASQVDDAFSIVAVGNTAVSGYNGATGGLVTICNEDLSSCSSKDPYLWRNNNSNTTTIFNDVIEYSGNYVVVGNSRVTSLYSDTNDTGTADALVVLLDSSFKIVNGALRGGYLSDDLYSIKMVSSGRYIAVGSNSGNGLYLDITVSGSDLTVRNSEIAGRNGSLEIKDVHVKVGKTNKGELNLVFVGATKATSVEGITLSLMGQNDALLIIVDDTKFSDYGDVSVLQGSAICSGGTTSCKVSNLSDDFKMKYGNLPIDVFGYDSDGSELVVSTVDESKTRYSVFHTFVSEQGVTFIIGKNINITKIPVAPDVQLNEQGINKWYLYSRSEQVLDPNNSRERKTLWTKRYMPVADYENKKDGVKYYVLEDSDNDKDYEFVLDVSERSYTYKNYIELAEESLNSNVAFQSEEKLEEYALIQEYARVAFVNNEKYGGFNSTGITAFQNEGANLSNQNYYFIYYIDLEFSNSSTCGTINGELSGKCSNYTGYAFANLSRIGEIAASIVKKYNSFKIEKNGVFVKSNSVSLPDTEYFKEELTTIQYLQNGEILLGENLYLEVAYYGVENVGSQSFAKTPVVTFKTGQSSVKFTADGDYKQEGKYVVRKCYNYVQNGENIDNCGDSGSFVIDRTKPVVNYKMIDEKHGVIDDSWAQNTPYLIGYSMTIESVVDIDPYAYTKINNKYYYLKCNEKIGSKRCGEDLIKYVYQSYSYDESNPNKVFNIKVSDRAGNEIDAYFKIGTDKPEMTLTPSVNSDSFTLNIDFFEKNTIDSFGFYFTSGKVCTIDDKCTEPTKIESAIMSYIEALIYNNEAYIRSAQTDPAIASQLESLLVKDITLQFNKSTISNNVVVTGLNIPIPEFIVEEGKTEGIFIFNDPIEPYLITDGLYEFILYDVFDNVVSVYTGIGLGKAELNIYINSDDSAVEITEDEDGDEVRNYVKNLIPVTSDEIGDAGVSANQFLVKYPQTYEFVVPSGINNGFNKDMHFTNRFIYVKFKMSEFGLVRISKAHTLNSVGSYGLSDETNKNLSCLFKIYGKNAARDVGSCSGGSTIPLADLVSVHTDIEYEGQNYEYVLNEKGIYTIYKPDTDYYYLVITDEGAYDIWYEISASVDTASGTTIITDSPSYYSFTIDRTAANIDLDVIGTGKKGELSKEVFNDSQFKGFEYVDENTYVYNIGNFDMQMTINLDKMIVGTDVDEDGDVDEDDYIINRLLVMSIEGPEQAANFIDAEIEKGTMTCNPYKTTCNAYEFASYTNTIVLTHDGTYKITIYDAAKNASVYIFATDKDAPEVVDIADANGKSFETYQQYVDVKLLVKENSFLSNNDGETMLTLEYWIGSSADVKTITYVNDDGDCKFSTGDTSGGTCTVVAENGVKGLQVNLVIPINKTERESGIKNLNIRLSDYFGNKSTAGQSFYFDNSNPYIYFPIDYTPTTDFGDRFDAGKDKMLTTSANASYDEFSCNGANGIMFAVGTDDGKQTKIIVCGDTPQLTGKENNVNVYAYEAYRVAFNNYTIGANGQPVSKINGTYLEVTDVVYRKAYTSFTSKTRLQSHISAGGKVYVSGGFVEVSSLDKIDPNEIYYLDDKGKVTVTIEDIYTANYSACSSSTSAKCVLYNMYNNYGDFSRLSDTDINPDGQKFYVYDRKGYTEASSVTLDDWPSYYGEEETYVMDNGKYLPALTLANSCIKVNGGLCKAVPEGRIKVNDSSVEYRNIVERMSTDYSDTSLIIVSTTMSDDSVKYTIADKRIWQIAVDTDGNQVKFGFGLASERGRPIIFVAKDGAGNISSNYLETVIQVKDGIKPDIEMVHLMYEVDNSEAATLDNYIKETKYYRLSSIPTTDACAISTSKYYYYEDSTYKEVTGGCGALVEGKQYYVGVEVYTRVADGMEKQRDVYGTYYKRRANDVLEGNYLTSENMVVEFSEPVNRIVCSYYFYDSTDPSAIVEKTFGCDFNNIEFDYRDDKRTFYLDFKYPDANVEHPNYFVVYTITVYDFSNNFRTFNVFYIDREKPVIEFRANASSEHMPDVVYSEGVSDESQYNITYITSDFLKEVLPTDTINNIGNVESFNKFSYEVKYYKFNYDITYANYVYDSSTEKYERVENGLSKSEVVKKQTYVLIKKPTDYVLKGNTGVCELKEDEEYCYVEDYYNYYESLVSDSRYWIALKPNEYIKNNSVAVYKIEYKVTDYSGNVSDVLTKTVYFVDTKPPILNINDMQTSNKYGYHMEVNLKVNNEYESNLYVYRCKDAVTTCELPSEIFAVPGSSIEMSDFVQITSTYSFKYNSESIYKLYLHDKGNYVYSKNADGELVKTLKYNYVDYTFLIDTTDPELYLNAGEEDGKLFYQAHLDKEEYLYCVSGDRFAEGLSFKDYIECKNSPNFSGEWKNNSDYVNMSVIYEYLDGVDSYKLSSANGDYILRKNDHPYKLEYKSDTEYTYEKEDRYLLRITGDMYELKINDNDYVSLTKTYSYKDTKKSIDYKLIVDDDSYKLYINEVENELILNNGVYEYKDLTNLISYSIRYINNTYQIRVMDEKLIIRKLYNSNGEVIYEEKYEKLSPHAQKYFYNTYYYKDGDSLIAYALGASYDENNVYIITSIDVFFRNDGSYLLMAKDKSGNDAGRRKSGMDRDSDYSSFVIDNTSPSYNKGQNTPTGINYWYSVPSVVINSQNMSNVKGVTKGNSNSYNLDSGLNTNFFYAFATKLEAKAYLEAIYSAHMETVSDNSCTKTINGVVYRGFNYPYYDPQTGTMESNCFVGKGTNTNKEQAVEDLMGDALGNYYQNLIFPTFSGNNMFNDSSVRQVVCNTKDCKDGTSMYKSAYLKIDYDKGTKNIAESCDEVISGGTLVVECIKVNVKMINYDSINGNSSVFEMGTSNAKDTSKVVVYSKSTTSGAENKTEYILEDGVQSATKTISLNNNSYYIFEEFDTTIQYTNYPVGEASYDVEHTNVTYYGIYVDNNDYINIYYDDGSGTTNNLTGSGLGVVRTNVDRYSLIIKDDGYGNFFNNYEIFAEYDSNDNISEIYSYLIVKVNDLYYYNLNDYLVRNGNDYYFEIPMMNEQVTKISFIDRTGTTTKVDVSLSKIAPSIEVVYNGEGASQTVNLVITDSSLTKTATDSIEIFYSPDVYSSGGKAYSDDKTADILAALRCRSGTPGLLYDCVNSGAVNGVNVYRVVIRDLQHLYGFFKVTLTDNHGNSNSLEFVYNPTDMSADYPSIVKFIDSNSSSDPRMITNDKVHIEFNNEINYVILYKYSGENLVEVCNSKTKIDEACVNGGDSQNRITRITDGEGNYIKTALYYNGEGMYTARIINRASEVINDACFTVDAHGVVTVKEDCKSVKTYRSISCSWGNNPDYCDDPFEIVINNVSKANGNASYSKLEIDKTAPQVDVTKFAVSTPVGEEEFINNGQYVNAQVTIKWQEDLTQLSYTCKYVNSARNCPSNSTGFYVLSKSHTFVILDNESTTFSFWFEDYAGNTTESNKYTFTIDIVPPEFEVYEMNDSGQMIEGAQILKNTKIKNNAQLLCRVEGIVSDCDIYDVVLERLTDNGYTGVSQYDLTKIYMTYGQEATFKYTLKIKNALTGEVYNNIKVEFEFTIDKNPPKIHIGATPDVTTGLYSGEVEVTLSSDGVGTIYSGCIDKGSVDEYGDKVYDCTNVVELAKFGIGQESNKYTLTKTGIYMIVAKDEIGNVTEGRDIKYVSIDNEAPTVSIKIKGEYLDYTIPENGFTNSDTVSVQVFDNNANSYFKYRIKGVNDAYGDWIYTSVNSEVPGDYLEFTAEGFYEIVPIDAIGNEGYAKHFIIYRSDAVYEIIPDSIDVSVDDFWNDLLSYADGVLSSDFKVTWSNSGLASYVAPIVKVTVNGRPYKSGEKITQTGEYVFEFTDLAGNITRDMVVLNKSSKICLNNVNISPRKVFVYPILPQTGFSLGDYEFKEDDVVIFAVKTYYFGGSSCDADSLSYKQISSKGYYFEVGGSAKAFNESKLFSFGLDEETISGLDGSFGYAIIVSKDVAKNDLKLPIGENFFTKDPLGWSLVFVAGACVLYVAVKLIFFRKKVRVLK